VSSKVVGAGPSPQSGCDEAQRADRLLKIPEPWKPTFSVYRTLTRRPPVVLPSLALLPRQGESFRHRCRPKPSSNDLRPIGPSASQPEVSAGFCGSRLQPAKPGTLPPSRGGERKMARRRRQAGHSGGQPCFLRTPARTPVGRPSTRGTVAMYDPVVAGLSLTSCRPEPHRAVPASDRGPPQAGGAALPNQGLGRSSEVLPWLAARAGGH